MDVVCCEDLCRLPGWVRAARRQSKQSSRKVSQRQQHHTPSRLVSLASIDIGVINFRLFVCLFDCLLSLRKSGCGVVDVCVVVAVVQCRRQVQAASDHLRIAH